MLSAGSDAFAASFIFAGQIGKNPAQLFQIYSDGNFIEATPDTPFFQIGEHKYGKPILDRVARNDMSLVTLPRWCCCRLIRRCART